MEHKNLKTSVFSMNTIFCESAEIPIDIEFTLPDYYADISKILKCRAISRITSKSVNGNCALVEGCVTVTVIYCGNDNCVSSYEYQYPFSKKFDTNVNIDSCILNVKTKCEYINCRAITGRKIDVHGAIGVYVSLDKRNMNDVLSDCDDCNVELLRESIPATVPMGMAEKYLLIEEEIELGAAQPDIRCVIRYDAEATITESKILAGKTVVKGDLALVILYAPEKDSTPQIVRCKMPFSQLVEIDGITDGCDCESKVKVAHLEIKPRVSANGECRKLMLTAKLLITSECCCNNDVEVILDAYSRRFEADIHKNEIYLNKIFDTFNKSFSCKKNLEFAEGAISAILDLWCETHVASVKFCDNAMKTTGYVNVFVIAQDSDAIPAFYEKTIDFEHIHPMDTSGEFKCAPEVTVTGINYTFTGESNVEIRVELNICAAVYKIKNLKLITDININENKPVHRENTGAMTLYYASKGEKIWDIAMRYLAGVDEIKQINDISEDVLACDKMILIPNN